MARKIFLNILRYTILLVLVVFVSTKLSWLTWNFYNAIFHEAGGTWVDLRSMVGFVLNYIFFVPLVFTLFGERFKYWVIGILFVPVLLYEFSGNFWYTTQDLLIASAGLGISWLLRYSMQKTPVFQNWKKYF